MAIIRVSKKQIQDATKAREAALAKNAAFRRHDEELRRLSGGFATRKTEAQR
jgi:hypothetical protein